MFNNTPVPGANGKKQILIKSLLHYLRTLQGEFCIIDGAIFTKHKKQLILR